MIISTVTEKSTVLCMPLDVTLETDNTFQRKDHTAFMFMDHRKTFVTFSHKILRQKRTVSL